MKWIRGHFEVDTDTGRLDYRCVVELIGSAYWAAGRSPEDIETSWRNSTIQFGLYDTAGEGRLVGVARVLSDKVVFAHLMDVFIEPAYRGQGLGKFLMECVMNHPDCGQVKSFSLVTRDAHGLYRHFGFEALPDPTRNMLRRLDRP